MVITSQNYQSREQLESDILDYQQALEAHAFTEGVPAPFPPNDLVEVIVKNNIEWEWVEVEETPPVSSVPEPIQGFDFVSDMYNDFLSKKFYFDELQEYQQLRSKEYPSVSDQLDIMFHSSALPEALMVLIREVKNKYPKPSPFPSWIYNSNTCQWEAPVVCPDDGKQYRWDEDQVIWVEATI